MLEADDQGFVHSPGEAIMLLFHRLIKHARTFPSSILFAVVQLSPSAQWDVDACQECPLRRQIQAQVASFLDGSKPSKQLPKKERCDNDICGGEIRYDVYLRIFSRLDES
jgi:hypothetical protein